MNMLRQPVHVCSLNIFIVGKSIRSYPILLMLEALLPTMFRDFFWHVFGTQEIRQFALRLLKLRFYCWQEPICFVDHRVAVMIYIDVGFTYTVLLTGCVMGCVV